MAENPKEETNNNKNPQEDSGEKKSIPQNYWSRPDVIARQRSYGEFLRRWCPRLDDDEAVDKWLEEMGI